MLAQRHSGKRAADEGRDAKYPNINFCRDPEAICASKEHQELKWIAGFFYWVESVQAYDEGGWNYMQELHKYVDEGMQGDSFINAVSGIVNRGCHNPPCGTGALDGGPERAQNFNKVVKAMEFSFVDVPAMIPEPSNERVFLDFLDIGNQSPPRQDCTKIGQGTAAAEKAFLATKDAFDNELFLHETPMMQWVPSSVYRFDGFFDGLKIMHSQGIAGKKLYMGGDDKNCKHCHMYGLINVAAFLAQAMKETIRYDACDENSWDRVGPDKMYPISNSCGQLGQSYQDYHCSDEEKHMECKVDPEMTITAVTNAKWWGAPGPLMCGPKSLYPQTGHWNYRGTCDDVWANPPKYCKAYEGQKGGTMENGEAYANGAGRTDVEGCCWWGRGVIQTTGICNFGKLNYFLGKRAADEGREAKYPDIDFCRDPEAICSSKEHQELKWIAGFFYWVESVQAYDEGGWNYLAELHKFVNEGMQGDAFIMAVSGIVNRGCHNPPCGTGALDGGPERAENFSKILKALECAFVEVNVKTPAPITTAPASIATMKEATKKEISPGLILDIKDNTDPSIDQTTLPDQKEADIANNKDSSIDQTSLPGIGEKPAEVLYECGSKNSLSQPLLHVDIDFFYELFISINFSVKSCLMATKEIMLVDVAIILGCSGTGTTRHRRLHRKLQEFEAIAELMSDKSDLPTPDTHCTSELDSTLPMTTCIPVRGKFTVSFMPDTTYEARKNIVQDLKNIVKKGMDSGRYETEKVKKAIYVGNRNVYAGDSITAGSESDLARNSGSLMMIIYFLSALCIVLIVAFCFAMITRRRDTGSYQAGDETSFDDFMMRSDEADGDGSFDAILRNKKVDYPHWSRLGANSDITGNANPPRVSEFVENARGGKRQSGFKSKQGNTMSNMDETDKRCAHSRLKSKPQIDVRPVESDTAKEDQQLCYPRSLHTPKTCTRESPPCDKSGQYSESSSSTDSSSRSSSDSSTTGRNTERPVVNLRRVPSTSSPARLTKEKRQRRMKAARTRASKRGSIN